MQQLIAVVFVVLSLWGAVWFLKRKGLAGTGSRLLARKRTQSIELLDKMRLSPQHSVHLLAVEGRRLLVAVHPGGVTVLAKPAGVREFTKGAAGN